MNCPFCHKEIPDDAQACRHCWKEIPKKHKGGIPEQYEKVLLNYWKRLVIGIGVLFLPLLAYFVHCKSISMRKENQLKAELLNKINKFAFLSGIIMYFLLYITYFNGNKSLDILFVWPLNFSLLISLAMASSTFSDTNTFPKGRRQKQDSTSSVDAVASGVAPAGKTRRRKRRRQQSNTYSPIDSLAKQFAGVVNRTNVEEYLSDLRRRADSGELSAQKDLGLLLLWGNIIPSDIEASTLLFKQAAEQGDSVGQYAYGMAYENGDGVPKDQNEAFRWIKKAADQNNPFALEELANCFEDGIVVQRDYEEAVRLWQKASDLGVSDAMYKLAIHFAKQIGDKQEATKWLFKAYHYGNELAAAVIMATIRKGNVIDNHQNLNNKPPKKTSHQISMTQNNLQNYVERTHIERYLDELRKRANSDDPIAQTELGGHLLRGAVIPVDIEEATRLFALAAKQGSAEAQWQLGEIYKSDDANYEAFKCFKKSAEQDYPPALHILGYYYAHGIGVKQDYDEAVRLWRKVADLGYSGGMFNLAGYYAFQVVDKQEATKWYFMASLHGDALSTSILRNALQEEL